MIAPGAVSSAPAGFLIEAFLVPPDTIPTDVMQTIVVGNRLYDVRRLLVALFATIDPAVFSRCHGVTGFIITF